MFHKITIMGVGLIGGSIAACLKKYKIAKWVMAVDRDKKNRAEISKMKIVHAVFSKLDKRCFDSDIIILAMDSRQVVPTIAAIQKKIKLGCVITDVSSTKQKIVSEADTLLKKSHSFVGGHPIAGSEKSGAKASYSELFKNKVCILTPSTNTDKRAVISIKKMWIAMGSHVVSLSSKEHDELLASVSHLPHLIAYCLVNSVLEDRKKNKLFNFYAGGFKDFTRVASSSASMWRDICLMNGTNILNVIDRFENKLHQLKSYILNQEGEKLYHTFSLAKKKRNKLVKER